MKKFKTVSALAIAACLMTAPVLAGAESIEDRINEQNQKIAALEALGDQAQKKLDAIQAEVAQIEADIQQVMDEKLAEEKRLNELTSKIENLKETIKKRDELIQSQARDVQTTQTAGSFIDVVVNSSSISEAISKTLALNTLVSANQAIMEAQIKDKQDLEDLQSEAKKKLASIEKKTEELQVKQDELAAARLDQEVKINELSAELATEEEQKQAYIAEKEAAEKRRVEELAAMEVKKLEVAQALEEAKAAEAANNSNTGNQTNSSSSNSSSSSSNSSSSSTEQSAGGSVTTSSSGWTRPLSSLSVTSPYGYRQNPVGPGTEFHQGVDFAGYSGMPVMAAKDGIVQMASYNGSAGNCVIIRHADGYYSYYMHLSSFAVSAGAAVTAGQTVGGMGTTGSSTGVHLHFGISTGYWTGYVNPAPLLGI